MKEPTAHEFAAVADAINLSYPELVEKDYYAVHLLKKFLEIDICGYDAVFSGGTCLSKVHIDLQRMSEDIDIKLVPSDKTLTFSRNKQKNLRKDLYNQLVEHFTDTIYSEYQPPASLNEYNSQTLYFQYPQQYKQYSESIKPYLQLELTTSNNYQNTYSSPIRTLLGNVSESDPEIKSCICSGLETILAEKIVSLLRRIAEDERGFSKIPDQFLVRHIYDIALAMRNNVDTTVLEDIFNKVINDDVAKYGNKHITFRDNPLEELQFGYECLINHERYQTNYAKFLGPLVYRSEPISWDDGLKVLKTLLCEISSIQ